MLANLTFGPSTLAANKKLGNGAHANAIIIKHFALNNLCITLPLDEVIQENTNLLSNFTTKILQIDMTINLNNVTSRI